MRNLIKEFNNLNKRLFQEGLLTVRFNFFVVNGLLNHRQPLTDLFTNTTVGTIYKDRLLLDMIKSVYWFQKIIKEELLREIIAYYRIELEQITMNKFNQWDQEKS